MILKVDKDGAIAVEQLCDVALKLNGMKAFEKITEIIRSTKIIEEDEPLELINPVEPKSVTG